jgi:organic radical activating enzyme
MMKILPIKLERSVTDRATKIVEWRLSNVCNFDCSFCPSEFKDGSKRPLELDRYKKIVDNLMLQSKGKIVWFQFSGGEPTLYPKLFDLLEYIKSKGGYTSIISNGSRTLRFWNEFAEKNILNRLFLSYHPEQEDSPDHVIEVNEIMQKTNTLVTIFVTTQTDPTLFNKALLGHYKILKEATAISTLKVIIDSISLQPYTANQLSIIQKNLYVTSRKWNSQSVEKFESIKNTPWYDSTMVLEYSNGSTRSGKAQYLIDHGLNEFNGWECDIGKDLMIIEIDEVFRGVCREGGPIFKITDEDISWKTDSIICQKNKCICGIDIQEPKRRING